MLGVGAGVHTLPGLDLDADPDPDTPATAGTAGTAPQPSLAAAPARRDTRERSA